MAAAEVDTITAESEEQLVTTARTALSDAAWVVGECAALWTKRYAKGRTDNDFGMLVGMTGDQVYQRRRVWETFADVRTQFTQLKWSHFYAALTWDDAPECLQWADETGSTVAEMKAWRRAIRGEDLTADAEPELLEGMIAQVPSDRSYVQDPDSFGGRAGGSSASRERTGEEATAVAGHARDLDGDDYAPFHQGAIRPPANADGGSDLPEPLVTAEQTARRLAGALERCTRVLSDEFLRDFETLPEAVQKRLHKASADLAERLQRLH